MPVSSMAGRTLSNNPREVNATVSVSTTTSIRADTKDGLGPGPCRCPVITIERHIRSDNGSAFAAKAVQDWITAVGAKTAHIMPGNPWKNGFIKSFNARLSDELLDGEICLLTGRG
jgi:transposase InsO family protein